MMERDLTEKTLETRRGFDGRLLRVRVDTVALPDGKTGTREIVEHSGSVVVVAVQDGLVHFVRQYRHAAGQTLLELPAGTVAPGEEHVQAARRETEEEIGMTPRRLTYLAQGYVSPGYSSELQSFWLAQDLSPVESRSDEDEFIDVVRMPVAEAIEWATGGECRDVKSVAGLLMAARKLGL
jgi:ADP-ribose pyrophosphatase